ncbi:MAG: hypothetical protein QXF55_01885, partial [Candidatus Aenigmatarchaeota archaeon]
MPELTPKMLELFEAWCTRQGIEGKEKNEKFEQFKALVQRASYEPGEAIGIIAAQLISEPAT